MLFFAGHAIPPGTRSLGDFIDQNDPCTANPNDPICQATANEVATDPCKVNPTAPYCQGGVVASTQDATPTGNDWSQYIDSSAGSQQTPGWVTQLVNAINGKTTVAPVTGQAPSLAASVGSVGKLLLIGGILIGGGYFVMRYLNKRDARVNVAA
jgi:hypothetical protein